MRDAAAIDHASFDQTHQVVDLLGVVAAVRHGHHDHCVPSFGNAVPDRLGGPGAMSLTKTPDPIVNAGVLLDIGNRGVVRRIDDDDDLTGKV